jgi:hypothetical protein
LVDVCVCFVSDAEQQFPATGDVLLWNQIIKADQFIFSALRPEIGWLSGPGIFLVLRCTHFAALIPAFVPQKFLSQKTDIDAIGIQAHTQIRFADRVKTAC